MIHIPLDQSYKISDATGQPATKTYTFRVERRRVTTSDPPQVRINDSDARWTRRRRWYGLTVRFVRMLQNSSTQTHSKRAVACSQNWTRTTRKHGTSRNWPHRTTTTAKKRKQKTCTRQMWKSIIQYCQVKYAQNVCVCVCS